LVIRATCTRILTELGSPSAEATLKRSMQFAHGIATCIRNPRLRARFLRRDVVQSLLVSADRLLGAPHASPALRA